MKKLIMLLCSFFILTSTCNIVSAVLAPNLEDVHTWLESLSANTDICVVKGTGRPVYRVDAHKKIDPDMVVLDFVQPRDLVRVLRSEDGKMRLDSSFRIYEDKTLLFDYAVIRLDTNLFGCVEVNHKLQQK